MTMVNSGLKGLTYNPVLPGLYCTTHCLGGIISLSGKTKIIVAIYGYIINISINISGLKLVVIRGLLVIEDVLSFLRLLKNIKKHNQVTDLFLKSQGNV